MPYYHELPQSTRYKILDIILPIFIAGVLVGLTWLARNYLTIFYTFGGFVVGFFAGERFANWLREED